MATVLRNIYIYIRKCAGDDEFSEKVSVNKMIFLDVQKFLLG